MIISPVSEKISMNYTLLMDKNLESSLATILFAAIGSSLIFIGVSAYWLRAIMGILILCTVLADMARRRRVVS